MNGGNMNLIKLLLILLSLNACSAIAAASNEQDAKLILDRLLHIDNEKYNTKNASGQFFYNSLLEYKDWERTYIKYSRMNKTNKKFTEHEIKNLLFIGFVSKVNSDAAISESLSSDLMPIFNDNKTLILNVIAELNFLIPSTCYYLNNYFGFEGKNKENKIPFIKTNKEIIIEHLGKNEGERCLVEFEKQ